MLDASSSTARSRAPGTWWACFVYRLHLICLVPTLGGAFAHAAPGDDLAIRVNAGGGTYVDSIGVVWEADTAYNTGNVWSTGSGIAGTQDDALYRTERWDPGTEPELLYRFAVPNRNYLVNLHFAEIYSGTWGVGERVFDVLLEGELSFDDLDIYSQVGANAPLVRQKLVTVTDGSLDIQFRHEVENPKLSAIEILSLDDVESLPAWLQDEGNLGLVAMEAEKFHAQIPQGAHEWTLVSSPGSSGDAALAALPDLGSRVNTGYETSSPRLDYRVDFRHTGRHYVWVRGIGSSGANDSLHVGIDGVGVASSDRISSFGGDWTWSRATMDGPVASLEVATPGIHTVNVWMREDGFVFDKLVVTTDAGYVPQGLGPLERWRAPTVSIAASSGEAAAGESVGLTWSSTNASTCAASGDWSGDRTLSGAETTGTLSHDSVFTLTCSGAGGSDTRSVTVSVAAPPAPTPQPSVSLSASPASVAYNGATTLTWSASNASSCTASEGWSGNKSTSGGSQTIGSLTSNVTFSLTCTGFGGSGSDSVNVVVAPPPAPSPTPSVSLSASPASVAYNGATTLTWSATNATACTATGEWLGNKSVSGNQTINGLTADSGFTLNCSGPGGSASESVSVTVDYAPIAQNDVAQTSQATPVNINVLGNDTGLDDAPLTLTVISDPSNGTASVNSGSAVRYVPAGSFAGQDSLNYRVEDADGDSATAGVSITVTCGGCAAGKTLLLSWDPNPPGEGVTGYKVFHGPTASTASTEVTDIAVSASGFNANAPSREYDAWNDLELNMGNQVCFRLKAYNSAGTSDFSSAACTVL